MRRAIPLLVGVLMVFGCATPRPVPPSRVAVVTPPPAPYVPPAPLPPTQDWRDWPLTPGDWAYSPTATGSTASFGSGSGIIGLQCFRASHTIVLSVDGGSAGPATLRTTSMSQTLTLAPAPGAVPAVSLSATDPLLDAIAFSRGRFVIQAQGRQPLVVPVYAEIGRVIEDCRG